MQCACLGTGRKEGNEWEEGPKGRKFWVVGNGEFTPSLLHARTLVLGGALRDHRGKEKREVMRFGERLSYAFG